MLDRLKKINVLGITVLIIAVVYLLVTLLNSLSETKYLVGLFVDYGFRETVYRMWGNNVVYYIYVILRMAAPYVLIAAGVFFVIAAVKRKGSIEIPVGLSLLYSGIVLFKTIVQYFEDPSIFGFFQTIAGDAFVLGAWVILVIGTSQSNRLGFAVLRSLTLVYGIVAIVRQLIGGYDLSIRYNLANFLYYVIHTVTMAGLILWILAPGLFYRKEDNKSVYKGMI